LPIPRLVIIDEDITWSDAPRRRRRVESDAAWPQRRVSGPVSRQQRGDDAPRERERERERIAEPVAEQQAAWDEALESLQSSGERDWHSAKVELIGEASAENEVELEQLALAAPERRTVVITGRPVERYQPVRRSSHGSHLPAHARAGFKPDRVAMWAVALGILLLLVAAGSAHAATLL
jgi:hypothetical protein